MAPPPTSPRPLSQRSHSPLSALASSSQWCCTIPLRFDGKLGPGSRDVHLQRHPPPAIHLEESRNAEGTDILENRLQWFGGVVHHRCQPRVGGELAHTRFSGRKLIPPTHPGTASKPSDRHGSTSASDDCHSLSPASYPPVSTPDRSSS